MHIRGTADVDGFPRSLGATPAPVSRRSVQTALKYFAHSMLHLDRPHQLCSLKAAKSVASRSFSA